MSLNSSVGSTRCRSQPLPASVCAATWHDGLVAQPSLPVSDLRRALTRARMGVEQHMVRAARAGISWREETVSELLWVSALPFVRCADFTHGEENKVGADWLWWWIDDTDE